MLTFSPTRTEGGLPGLFTDTLPVGGKPKRSLKRNIDTIIIMIVIVIYIYIIVIYIL
jgi:hypothetical protein